MKDINFLAEEKDRSLSVLLATYNGERFLREQLDSLIRQSYKNFQVYIRDDGSSDNTIAIIQEYMDKYGDKFILVEDDVSNRGPMNSFMYLLSVVDSDYYMFCDQDDVWLENKIQDSIEKIQVIERLNPGKPVMVHTDLRIVDENLNVLSRSFWNWRKFNVDLNKHKNFVPFGNVFTGCTMIINNAVKAHAFPLPEFASMHDQWIGLVAVKFGIVDNIKAQTILYRQHGGNVCSTGNRTHIQLRKLFRKSGWLKEVRPIMRYLDYGGTIKAYLCKWFYSTYRMFFYNRGEYECHKK